MTGFELFILTSTAGLAVGVLGLAAYLIRLDLRFTVPGSFTHEAPESTRVCVIGEISTGEPLRAPLTGLPCVAWRLTVRCREFQSPPTLVVHERYSAGSFEIHNHAHDIRVTLREGSETRQRIPYRTLRAPWRLPPATLDADYAVEVSSGEITLPLVPNLSSKQADITRSATRAEIERHGRTIERGMYDVIETRVDSDQRWACEGPLSQPTGGPAIISAPNDASVERVIKLAPASDLERAYRELVWRPTLKVSLFMAIFLTLIIVFTLVE